MCDASLSESPEEEEDNDSPGPERGSTPLSPISPTTEDWLESPRKRTQTLPTFNCPLTGMAAKADALNRWSRHQDISEEKSGTLSEDIFKILDLRNTGSLFGGSKLSNKEGADRATARRGSDTTAAATDGCQTANSDSKPAAPVLTHQRSAGSLTLGGPAQQLNSSSKQQRDRQTLVER